MNLRLRHSSDECRTLPLWWWWCQSISQKKVKVRVLIFRIKVNKKMMKLRESTNALATYTSCHVLSRGHN